MVDDDEQLAKGTQESRTVRNGTTGNANRGAGHFCGICAGCNTGIRYGRIYLERLNALWHPQCFRCYGCNHLISDQFQLSTHLYHPYHKACLYHPKCDICSLFLPTNDAGVIVFCSHPFWVQKYCPSHEHDATPKCCSCHRMEPRNTRYFELNDGRKLCPECEDSAVMDSFQCLPLYFEIQEFYEGLNMKIEQQVPLLLVESEAINEAREDEKNCHYHKPKPIGICISEEQTLSTVRERSTRRREVIAILILFGLPRLLTGSVLAHEMMHAWMRLNGVRTLSRDVEEGICNVMAHKWLEAELASGSSNSNDASSFSYTGVKKGSRSHEERKLGEYFKLQIEYNDCPVYGDGFRAGRLAVHKYGLRTTLEHIKMTGQFPV